MKCPDLHKKYISNSAYMGWGGEGLGKVPKQILCSWNIQIGKEKLCFLQKLMPLQLCADLDIVFNA